MVDNTESLVSLFRVFCPLYTSAQLVLQAFQVKRIAFLKGDNSTGIPTIPVKGGFLGVFYQINKLNSNLSISNKIHVNYSSIAKVGIELVTHDVQRNEF